MREKKIAPSLLSADFSKLGEELERIEATGADMVHIDVMDGVFVPSISLGMPVIASIRKESSLCFDVHLMVQEPGRYVKDIAKAGADMITVHAEACTHLKRVIDEIKDCGRKACVALNPATPLNALDYVLDDVDMVLLMTVNPGFGGQTYIPAMTEKIKKLRKILDIKGMDIPIEVDGGIKLKNAKQIAEAGADILVAGSAVFGADTKLQVEKFRRLLEA